MIHKVKHWLGIEGVKLEILADDTLEPGQEQIRGKIRLYSKTAHTVTGIKLVLVEKYTRGRGKDKRTDEYTLGETSSSKRVEVPAEGAVELDFVLPFSRAKSEVDDWQEKNAVNQQIGKLAKWMEGVQSEFRLEAEAKVEGVALNPFDRKIMQL